jgi:hypothetical protein
VASVVVSLFSSHFTGTYTVGALCSKQTLNHYFPYCFIAARHPVLNLIQDYFRVSCSLCCFTPGDAEPNSACRQLDSGTAGCLIALLQRVTQNLFIRSMFLICAHECKYIRVLLWLINVLPGDAETSSAYDGTAIVLIALLLVLLLNAIGSQLCILLRVAATKKEW